MTTPPQRRLPLRWEAPPKPLTADEMFALEWADVAPQLKGRPGDWAVIAEGLTPNESACLTTRIRVGAAPFLNDGNGKFESGHRTSDAKSREVTVYARYVVSS